MSENSGPVLTVFYDGACPLCLREIKFYRCRRGADAVAWRDVSQGDTEQILPGLSRCDALRRFHVQTSEGVLVSGAAAFAALWRVLPAFRWLGQIASAPLVLWFLEHAYRVFLKVRPVLQKSIGKSAQFS